jgi:Ca-activated chloride channel homolog
LRRLVDTNVGPPVVIFTIGFGRDVDATMLEEMARIGGGQYRFTDEANIEELYRIISTYF